MGKKWAGDTTGGAPVVLPSHVEERIKQATIRLLDTRLIHTGKNAGDQYRNVETVVGCNPPRRMEVRVRRGWDGTPLTPEQTREEARNRLRVACLGALKLQEEGVKRLTDDELANVVAATRPPLEPAKPKRLEMDKKGRALIITGPANVNAPEGG